MQTNEELLQRAKEGNEDAILELWHQARKIVFSAVKRWGREANGLTKEDLAQEFLLAFRTPLRALTAVQESSFQHTLCMPLDGVCRLLWAITARKPKGNRCGIASVWTRLCWMMKTGELCWICWKTLRRRKRSTMQIHSGRWNLFFLPCLRTNRRAFSPVLVGNSIEQRGTKAP